MISLGQSAISQPHYVFTRDLHKKHINQIVKDLLFFSSIGDIWVFLEFTNFS